MYGLKHDETGYILGTANYGHNSYSTNRNVAISGLNQLLQANFAGDQAGANAETGLKLAASPFNVPPLIGLQYLYLGQQGFNESGGPAGLSVAKSQANSLRANVGARVLLDAWLANNGTVWTPYSHVRFISELLDNDRIINASFNGSPIGGAFTAHGTRIGRNYGVIGGGLEVRVSEFLSFFGGADLMEGDRITVATGSIGSVSRW